MAAAADLDATSSCHLDATLMHTVGSVAQGFPSEVQGSAISSYAVSSGVLVFVFQI